MSNENETTNNTNDEVLGEKLKAAEQKAAKEIAVRRERAVKGSHLQEKLVELANTSGGTVAEKSGFLKVTGTVKGRAVYVAKKGGRVDLSGFSVEEPAIKQVSEQEARDKHLGKVRGQLDFNQADDAVLSAFSAALAKLLAE